MPSEFLEKMFGLAGQTAVVIGGTGVLGGALAEGIAQAGARVIIAGDSAERGQARAAQIKAGGGHAEFSPVNVTSRESIAQLLSSVLSSAKRVDMLVNCAGVNAASTYFEASDDDW